MKTRDFYRSLLLLVAAGGALSGQTVYVPGGTATGIANNTANSNVGIGTATPASKLTVWDGRFQVSDGTNSVWIFGGSSGGLTGGHIGTINNVPLAFFTNSSGPKMTITSSGNVGIGTWTPNYTLDVAGNVGLYGTAPALFVRDSDHVHSSVGVAGYISFRDSSGVEFGWVGDGSESNNYISVFAGTNHGVQFGAGGAARMWISPAGNVGIGTSAPIAALTVHGQLTGGIGAHTTGGVADWNDISNTRAGSGYSLLLGSASHGPGPSVNFHPFNFEYGTKDGSGSITQLAIPYGHGEAIDAGIWMRGRYWSDPWGPWVRIIGENTSGKVGIGTLTPSHKLTVNGPIRAKEVIVDTDWADHVFAPDYELAPLSEVEAHINEHQHLPGIPSAKEVAEQGVSVGEMQAKLLAKIEELTLHIIAQQKLISGQAEQIAAQSARLERLEADRSDSAPVTLLP